MVPILDILSRALTDSTQEALFKLFIALQLFGFVGCVIILGTIIFSDASRQLTWFSFIFSWIISSFSYLLLFMTGQLENKRPPFGLCLAQAVLIYSAPPLTAATTLALVTEVYFRMRKLFLDQSRRKENKWTTALLIIIPYLLHFTMAVACLTLGLSDPGTVGRNSVNTYCNLKNRIPSKVSSIIVASLMVPTIFIEIRVWVILRRDWQVKKYPPSSALRAVGFSTFGTLAIVISIAFTSIRYDHRPGFNVILAMMPAVAVLIFGVQHDILSVWMFWRKSDPSRALFDTVDSASITLPHAQQVISPQTTLRNRSPTSLS